MKSTALKGFGGMEEVRKRKFAKTVNVSRLKMRSDILRATCTCAATNRRGHSCRSWLKTEAECGKLRSETDASAPRPPAWPRGLSFHAPSSLSLSEFSWDISCFLIQRRITYDMSPGKHRNSGVLNGSPFSERGKKRS